MPIHTITTWLSSVPPVAIAVLIALIYIFFAGGRWSWPMVVDAGLLGLYIWKPYISMLAFVLFLGSVRHVPALAREVVVVLKLHEFDGWTLRCVVFALPALKVYANTAAHDHTLPPMVAPNTQSPAPTLILERELPLLLGEGLKALNTDPTAPHVGVIGATRLGKTTFVGVVVAHRVSDLVIATPKAKQFDPWFDAEVARPVMQGDEISYAPLDQAVSNVYREMLRRNAPGGTATPVITLIIDEWPQVAGELPSLVKKVINLLRMGAACGIRVILMATDINVRGWKMDGVAGVLDNLIFAKVEDGRKWSIGRLDANWRMVAPRALETGQVWGIAARVSLAGRGWQAPAGSAPAPAGGLLGLGQGDGVAVGAVGVSAPGGGPDPRQTALQTQTNKQTQTNDRIALYAEWRAAGIKREQARRIRQSMGEGLDDAEWAEAGKRIQP